MRVSFSYLSQAYKVNLSCETNLTRNFKNNGLRVTSFPFYNYVSMVFSPRFQYKWVPCVTKGISNETIHLLISLLTKYFILVS